jgi:hypothetical protein
VGAAATRILMACASTSGSAADRRIAWLLWEGITGSWAIALGSDRYVGPVEVDALVLRSVPSRVGRRSSSLEDHPVG